jgi:GTP cyclohydrolase I
MEICKKQRRLSLYYMLRFSEFSIIGRAMRFERDAVMSLQEHEGKIKELLQSVGEDPYRDGLIKTPARFLESMSFLTSGYSQNLNEMIGDALFDETYRDMVVVKNIEFYSLCEHHLLPFYGKCHIGYIPTGKIIGLSKIPRIVNMFSRRLQVQERLTHQIGEALAEILKPLGVGVVLEAYHLCMMMRGVEKQTSYTMTSFLSGALKKQETRTEFLSFIQNRK